MSKQAVEEDTREAEDLEQVDDGKEPPADPPKCKVQAFGDEPHTTWHLVETGSWQVSVAPDGLIMLPRHLHPEEVADFCAAVTAAADVGNKVVKDNQTAAEADMKASEEALVMKSARRGGGAKMQVTPRSELNETKRASIARAGRRGNVVPAPAQVNPPAPISPIPGVTDGRKK
jgi:hypothetical protein